MSPKNTFDASDLVNMAENIAIFLIPMIISNQVQITDFLMIHGINATVSATIFSVLAYFVRRFSSGDITVGDVSNALPTQSSSIDNTNTVPNA